MKDKSDPSSNQAQKPRKRGDDAGNDLQLKEVAMILESTPRC